MTTMRDAVADAARALVGVRFRPQGRDAAVGLDCVGLAAAALARAGRPVTVPRDYRQRGGDAARLAAMIDRPGLVRIDPLVAGAGDILLLDAGIAQFHIAVQTDAGLVHADAGLRRIVETPGPSVRPILAAWRVEEDEG